MRASIRLLLVVLPAFAAGCSGTSGGDPVPLGAKIGPEGGELKVGLADVTLVVPPGALDHEVMITLVAGSPAPRDGWRVVSTAYEFAPASTTFAVPAALRVMYDMQAVSAAVADDELRVAQLDASGAVSYLTPIEVAAGRAALEISDLGSFWVEAPDVVGASELFPLNDGDVYRFDSGLSIVVDRTTREPNLDPLEVAKVTVLGLGEPFGTYYDTSGGELALLGSFMADQWQELFTSPVPLIDERDGLGTVRSAVADYVGYVPVGSIEVAYRGQADVTVAISSRQFVTTPLGRFDTVHVPTMATYRDDSPAVRDEAVEDWFAPGIGPVAIQLSDGRYFQLLGAQVGGSTVVR